MACGAIRLRAVLFCGRGLRQFPESCELSEGRQDGFFLRKNPISMVVPVDTIPENALPTVKGVVNLLVGFVLAERVDGPDRRRNPADERDLKHQADDAGEGSADGEELKPGDEDGQQQAHTGFLSDA